MRARANLEKRRKWLVVVAAPPSGSDFSLYAVEERVELIILLLGNRIVFVIVALCATNSEAEKHLSRRICAVHRVGNIKFIGVSSTLFIERHATIEAGCHPCGIASLGEEVACHIFHNKPVIGFVAVKGVDDVVPVEPHGAHGVIVIAVGVSVACEIEPVLGHALSVMRRVDHGVDEIGILFR